MPCASARGICATTRWRFIEGELGRLGFILRNCQLAKQQPIAIADCDGGTCRVRSAKSTGLGGQAGQLDEKFHALLLGNFVSAFHRSELVGVVADGDTLTVLNGRG